MHPEQMLLRAPHSPMAGTGWLHGWRLTFGGEDLSWEGALATLVEDPLSKVFVVLYDMTKEDEATLDRWEGSELGFHKKIRCRVDRLSSDTNKEPVLAWLYVRRRMGGRHTVGALPGRDGRGSRDRRCAIRVRARSAHPPCGQRRPGDIARICEARRGYRQGRLFDDVGHHPHPDGECALIEVERRLVQIELRTVARPDARVGPWRREPPRDTRRSPRRHRTGGCRSARPGRRPRWRG